MHSRHFFRIAAVAAICAGFSACGQGDTRSAEVSPPPIPAEPTLDKYGSPTVAQ